MIEHVIIKHVMTQRDMIKCAMSTGSELAADCEGCGGGGGLLPRSMKQDRTLLFECCP